MWLKEGLVDTSLLNVNKSPPGDSLISDSVILGCFVYYLYATSVPNIAACMWSCHNL